MQHKSIMKNVAFALLVIRAVDIDISAAFYRALGIDLVQEQHGAGPEHYASVLGDTVFEIYPRKADQAPPEEVKTLMIGFRVDDLDEVMETLKTLGTELNKAPVTTDWGRSITVNDPDGYRVQITESLG